MTRNGKVTLLIIGVIVVVAVTIVLNKPKTPDQSLIRRDLPTYWEQALVSQAVQDVGLPIEGFDAELLMTAYPGLQLEDFENVITAEGRYDYVGGQLQFLRTQGQPVSSAEKMIVSEGYQTLLHNVAGRLGVKVRNMVAVEVIIRAIDTAQRSEAGIGETAAAFGIQIIPQTVIEDSRCPVDVQCIQAGTVRLEAQISDGGNNTQSQIFTLEQAQVIFGYQVSLAHVEPEARSTTPIAPSDYRFFFEVKK